MIDLTVYAKKPTADGDTRSDLRLRLRNPEAGEIPARSAIYRALKRDIHVFDGEELLKTVLLTSDREVRKKRGERVS